MFSIGPSLQQKLNKVSVMVLFLISLATLGFFSWNFPVFVLVRFGVSFCVAEVEEADTTSMKGIGHWGSACLTQQVLKHTMRTGSNPAHSSFSSSRLCSSRMSKSWPRSSPVTKDISFSLQEYWGGSARYSSFWIPVYPWSLPFLLPVFLPVTQCRQEFVYQFYCCI